MLAKPNPFANLLAQAAKAPAHTGEVARIQQRLTGGGSGVVIVADVSSSMAEMAGARPKIQVLREALAMERGNARIIAFSYSPTEVRTPEEIPEPNGSTALHLALEMADTLRPERTLVISDGHPESEEKALRAADNLRGRIDVLYIGPEDDLKAIRFMSLLARVGAGRCEVNDIRQAPALLAPAVRALLGSGR